MKGAAIAQWICLRLPSCHPRFESQAHHLSFHQFVELFNLEKDKNKQKEAGIGPYLQKVLMNYFKTSVFTLCGGISATHFPKSKKHIYFCDRKLKFGTVVGTYVYYFGLKFQLDIFSGSGDN